MNNISRQVLFFVIRTIYLLWTWDTNNQFLTQVINVLEDMHKLFTGG